jgi:hypothetical protein
MARSKYGNVQVRGYDSKKEARRADELRMMEKAGWIKDLQEQVPYELIPTIFEAPDGRLMESTEEAPISKHRREKLGLWCVERCCTYIADFVYTDCATGKLVVEDTKGYHTKDYIVKRKLMLWLKGIKIREV